MLKSAVILTCVRTRIGMQLNGPNNVSNQVLNKNSRVFQPLSYRMEELNRIYNDIEKIQISLRKLGKRREIYTKYVSEKITKAKELYETHGIIVLQLDDKYKIKYAECIFDLCYKIEVSFNKILAYELNPSLFKDMSDKEESTMDKFNLKTAVSLIPVMDGNEETTEKIISSIELYDSYLKSPECKTLGLAVIAL